MSVRTMRLMHRMREMIYAEKTIRFKNEFVSVDVVTLIILGWSRRRWLNENEKVCFGSCRLVILRLLKMTCGDER